MYNTSIGTAVINPLKNSGNSCSTETQDLKLFMFEEIIITAVIHVQLKHKTAVIRVTKKHSNCSNSFRNRCMNNIGIVYTFRDE